MKNVFLGFKEAFKIMLKDKWVFLFSLVPVALGLVLFAYFGHWAYRTGLDYGNDLIVEMLGEQSMALSILLKVILFIPLYFLVSYSFIVVVGIIASPFNDAISARVEKRVRGEGLPLMKETMGRMFGNFFRMIFNELKKMLFILTLIILSLALNVIPVLAPLSFALSGLVLAISFIDYAWARRELPVSQCMGNVRKNFISYTLAGLIFMGLIAVPVLNLFILPYGVVYFTILYVKQSLPKSAAAAATDPAE